MTWTVNLSGHDEMEPEAKAEFENGLVEKFRDLVTDLKLKEGVRVSVAQMTTNTTGSVNLLTES